MNRLALILAAALSLAPGCRANDPEPVEIRMIANMGVLISRGENRVMIDALFTDAYEGRFRIPVEADRLAMIEGSGEFPRGTLMLFTHSHGDHFDADLVRMATGQQGGGRIIGPADVLAMHANGDPEAQTEPVGGTFTAAQRQRYGFDLDSRPMFHMNGIDNLTYAVSFGEITLLHLGDTNPDEADLSVWDDTDIDVVMYPIWWDQSERGQAKLNGDWADAIHIALHIPASVSREDAVAHFGEGHVLVDAGERITINAEER